MLCKQLSVDRFFYLVNSDKMHPVHSIVYGMFWNNDLFLFLRMYIWCQSVIWRCIGDSYVEHQFCGVYWNVWGNICDSDEVKSVRLLSWLVNRWKVNVEKGLMVRIDKSGSTCLAKICDTAMWITGCSVKELYLDVSPLVMLCI